MATRVTIIFDIGKTNKKFFLFDDKLNEIDHAYKKFPRGTDDDGDPCDDLAALSQWIRLSVEEIRHNQKYDLKAINFSTYGATLVHLDEKGHVVTPMYDYLKPFPEELRQSFQEAYGSDDNDRITASPYLGMLNSGLQLYWLKYAKPDLFRKIRHTLHFPQYLSYLFTGKVVTEPTSIGCHTKLWDFEKNDYADWVHQEGLHGLFPSIVNTTHAFEVEYQYKTLRVGVGIHDSSSALAAYKMRVDGSFLLVSTGTWSIVLNPFTEEVLTKDELQRDCLAFLGVHGSPVKASRLFLGHELDHQLKMLNERFNKPTDYYKSVTLDPAFVRAVASNEMVCEFYPATIVNHALVNDVFSADRWDLSRFSTYEEAYHQVMWGLILLQVASIRLALGNSSVRKIFVDGGFIDNDLYVGLLKHYLPNFDIEISQLPLGSAYGAAAVVARPGG